MGPGGPSSPGSFLTRPSRFSLPAEAVLPAAGASVSKPGAPGARPTARAWAHAHGHAHGHAHRGTRQTRTRTHMGMCACGGSISADSPVSLHVSHRLCPHHRHAHTHTHMHRVQLGGEWRGFLVRPLSLPHAGSTAGTPTVSVRCPQLPTRVGHVGSGASPARPLLTRPLSALRTPEVPRRPSSQRTKPSATGTLPLGTGDR